MAKLPLEKLEKLKRPHKIGIVVGTIVILGALFFFLLYSPLTEAITETEASIDTLKKEVNQQLNQVKVLPKVKERLAEVKLQFEFSSQFLPEKKDVDKLLRQISDDASQSGLNVTLFQPKPQEDHKDFYAEITFDMTVEGPYLNVATFFYRIGNLSRIVNIGNINMGTPKIEEGIVILTTSCQGKTFRFLTEEELEAQKKAAQAAQKKAQKSRAPKKAEKAE